MTDEKYVRSVWADVVLEYNCNDSNFEVWVVRDQREMIGAGPSSEDAFATARRVTEHYLNDASEIEWEIHWCEQASNNLLGNSWQFAAATRILERLNREMEQFRRGMK